MSSETADTPIAIKDLHKAFDRSEEHTSELQSQSNLVCRLLLEKKKINEYLPAHSHITLFTICGSLTFSSQTDYLPFYCPESYYQHMSIYTITHYSRAHLSSTQL